MPSVCIDDVHVTVNKMLLCRIYYGGKKYKMNLVPHVKGPICFFLYFPDCTFGIILVDIHHETQFLLYV
jgi:hypothetical protein